MDKKITVTLPDATHAWLERESALAGKTPKEFLTQFLADLADPKNIEDHLIDQLLIESLNLFPPLMELDEQTEMREEVLDFLCHDICKQYSIQIGETLSDWKKESLREQLAERAEFCWS